jgi:hypothetical protein
MYIPEQQDINKFQSNPHDEIHWHVL